MSDVEIFIIIMIMLTIGAIIIWIPILKAVYDEENDKDEEDNKWQNID